MWGGVNSIVTYNYCNPHAGIRAGAGIFVAPESGTWQFTFSGFVAMPQGERSAYTLGTVNVLRK